MLQGTAFVRLRAVVASLTLFGICCAAATPAEAQSRRARLSRDLAARVGRDGSSTRVILHGTAEQVARVAGRHGLSVRRHLPGGGLVEVAPGQLETVVNEPELDNATLDAEVYASMDVTVVSTGADQAWSGEWRSSGNSGRPAGRPVTGRATTVAVIDSGIDPVPQLRNRILANVDFTESGTSQDDYGHGTHVAGVIGAVTRRDPHGHVRMAIPARGFRLRRIAIPVLPVVAVWLVAQLAGIAFEQGEPVAFLAHATGFIVGVLLAGPDNRRPRLLKL